MSRLLPASRLGVFKDLGVLAFIAAFLACLWFFLFPALFSAQLHTVERRYFEEQEILVSRTVDEAAALVTDLDARLGAAGLVPALRDEIVLASLKNQRFGVGGYGYFFVFTDRGQMLMHPILADLVGRNLADIQNPDGLNMGRLLLDPLVGHDSARVEYRWSLPRLSTPEAKTTFLRRIPSKGWVVASGFYHSDFQPTRDAFLAISDRALADARWLTLAAALAFVAVGLAFAVRVFVRVQAIERSLVRHTARLEQYKLLLDKSSLVSRTTPDGIITAVNDTFCEVTGYTRDQALGQSHNLERHPDTPLEVFRDLWGTVARGQVWQGTLKNKKADGTSYLKRATIVPILDEKGRIVEYLSSGQDVTEVFENRGRLQLAFMTDPVTGLGNRARFLLDVDTFRRPGVVLVDAVDFSGLNAVYGQEAGDLVLRHLARTLLDTASPWSPVVYRLHTDTFALVTEAADPAGFGAQVRALAEALAGFEVDLGGRSTPVPLRFGAAAADRDAVVLADEALARARASRTTVVVHDPDRDGQSGDLAERLRILRTLRWALDHGKVFPLFQPLIDLATGRVEKYECLMRVEDEEGRVLLPQQFMEISKKTRVYQALSQRLFQVGLEAARWGAYDFSVNLTMEDLTSAPTLDFLVAEARRTGTARRLIVEVVETEELEDLDRTDRVFDALRAEGIRLAVDDFGSGYASFDYLLRLNPAFVKIDGSIVQKILDDPRARDLVASIVGFARKAGMKTVAEYLDTATLVETVRALGVDYGQGWHIGKGGPAPSE